MSFDCAMHGVKVGVGIVIDLVDMTAFFKVCYE